MGYKIVAVNPLKPFPIARFELANVVSLDNAKGQIRTRSTEAGLAEIKANEAVQELDAEIKKMSAVLVGLMERRGDLVKEEVEKIKKQIAELEAASRKITVPIRVKHEANANAEITLLEARWAEGKIEPALTLHLKRQERRFAHFNAFCRAFGCDNPRRQKRGRGFERNTKAHRPGVRPFFCGVHVGFRKLLTREALAELHASSAKRVTFAA